MFPGSSNGCSESVHMLTAIVKLRDRSLSPEMTTVQGQCPVVR